MSVNGIFNVDTPVSCTKGEVGIVGWESDIIAHTKGLPMKEISAEEASIHAFVSMVPVKMRGDSSDPEKIFQHVAKTQRELDTPKTAKTKRKKAPVQSTPRNK